MSTSTFLEVEAKFAVPDTAVVPDLTRLEGVDAIASTKTHRLSAIYYDTADLRLTRSKITLRRREGGDDDGWHIKLPGVGGRLEIHAPLGEMVNGRYEVPEDIQAQVRALVRREDLHPIAQVDNERVLSTLASADGTPMAEFCDDHVSAWSLLQGGAHTSWREWEIELAGDNPATTVGNPLLQSASQVLVSAGARMSTSPSKLAMALGDSGSAAPLPPFLVDADVDPDSPAAAVIAALKLNRDKLHEFDPKVRRDEWDSVHQMRVATRELRSHMETFNGILGGEELEYIESELKLLAGMLGHARDAEVVEERFLRLLDSEDSDVLDETTREHLRHDMGEEYRRAHRRVVATLNSDRYLDLLDAIDALLADPPVAGAHAYVPAPQEEEPEPVTEEEAAADLEMVAEGGAGQPVVEVATDGVDPEEDTTEEEADMVAEGGPEDVELPPEAQVRHAQTPEEVEQILSEHLEEAYKKLMKRHKKAVSNWDNRELTLHEREEYFHDMRKSAKKLRYAAEAVGAATQLKTKRLYNACKAMQSSLGDFQDAVTSRDKLVQMATAAGRRGENTFGYGLLYQRERATGLKSLEDYADEVKAIKAAYARLMDSVEDNRRKEQKKAKKSAEKSRKK
ncbi:CYTH and CHAD domain-containing protein [Corynebacterium sp.]|uniref:CYTH and CHAD domain-containing protein n=1 Tax=Corynebacterium sp. TaxID=1720 RepID=UPI0026DF75AD|nr:CYTH and CHAD domain-containing protein [Corynebacterium sp.]MDO5511412.1 CYTH and CHAD domain-containing protein [Corynebacterium sp.]